jgi:hypothetical protein
LCHCDELHAVGIFPYMSQSTCTTDSVACGSDDRRLCATEREWTYCHSCGNSINNALWKQCEETNMSTAELKMVPGKEFIFKYTTSQISISKRWLQDLLANGQSNYNKSYGQNFHYFTDIIISYTKAMPVPFHSTTQHHIPTSTVILFLIYLAQNRDRWWTIANAVLNLQGL